LYAPPTLSKEYKIPQTVTTIAEKAFFKCSNLAEIIIPGSVKYVNVEEFSSCKNLKKIILQNGVKLFNTFSFEPLNVEYIELPESIKEINFASNLSSFLPKLKKIRLSNKTKIRGKYPYKVTVLRY
jgi:hypothetical protein